MAGWILVNIISYNSLLSDSAKTSPALILTAYQWGLGIHLRISQDVSDTNHWNRYKKFNLLYHDIIFHKTWKKTQQNSILVSWYFPLYREVIWWYGWTSVYHGLLHHTSTYNVTMKSIGFRPDFEHTIDTPYLALTGELWSVFCVYFAEKWPCYKKVEQCLCEFLVKVFWDCVVWMVP